MLNLKIRNHLHYIPIFVLSLLVTNTIIAQDATTKQSIFDVMNYQEVLAVTLEADFAAIDTSRRVATGNKGILSFEDATGKEQRWTVDLVSRGNFRRMRCEMVPLKLNFKKKQLKAAGLAKFDDMKLVTHCVSNKGEAKVLLQKEYLAYRMYNELTENSYRVQLLKITYKDTKTGKKRKHWAFLIEDTAQLKKRIGATESIANQLSLPRDTFHSSLLKVASVFQYMIGNSDWDLSVGRNVKYVLKDGKVLPIPYDFDFSGLVDAPYAIPNPNFGIPNVKTRIYLGFKEDSEKLKGTLAYFKTKRLDLMELVDNFKPLDTTKRIEVLDYLNSFYATMNNIAFGEKIDFNSEIKIASLEKE